MCKTKTFLLMIVLLFVGIPYIYAQSVTVSGTVKDNEGFEVIGASVVLKGAAGVGTITDINGQFSLTVNDASKDALVFSYVGMKTKTVKLNGKTQVNVTLEADAVALDEVVAIGYATVKRRDLTGSVASVNTTELSKVPTSDVTQALAGRMPGVQVMQSEGQPGASISIRVRGGISITQDNEPLYIIDGFPSEDGMTTLDPAEIETIDVLKDASSTAIYGARGANGVVVITTKSGAKNEGKATVTFDTYIGVKTIAKKLDVLDPYEFVKLDYERSVFDNDNDDPVANFEKNYGPYADIKSNYLHRSGINWQEETLGRNALVQNYRVGVSGGNKKMNYALAYSFFDEQGAMVYSGSRKHNISANISNKVNDRLTINARISYDQMRVEGMGTSENDSRFNKMSHILQYRPTVGINGVDEDLLGDEDPMLQDEAGNVMQNPLLSAAEELNNKEYRTFQAKGGFTFKIIKGLTFRSTFGMRYQNRRDDVFFGDKSISAKRSSIHGSITNRETNSFQTSNVLTYNYKKNSHDFTIMAGQEFVNKWTRGFSANATNFPNDEIGLNDLSLGLPGTPSSFANYDDKLLSFFGRVNYNLKDKYLFTASVRADGSSKFGANNKWGYFPSVSAAWRMSEEDFIKDLEVFSDLKLRVGYGLAGNNRIASYQSLAILSSNSYPMGDSTQPGYVSNQVPNPDLKWEANKTFNIGLDFGFFNQRLTISPEFYLNRSSNLLLNTKLPTSSGFQSMIINAGETQNMGIDLMINSVNFQNKNFTWNTSITFSHNKNTIQKLTGEDVQLWEARFGFDQKTHIIGIDQPLGQFYGYKTAGLYQVEDFDFNPATGKYTLKEGIPAHKAAKDIQPGDWKFRDISGADGKPDGKIDERDKTVIGNAYPIFYGGINNSFTIFKDWDFSFFLTYSFGNDVMNATKLVNTQVGRKNKNGLNVADQAHRFTWIDEEGNRLSTPEELAAANVGKTFPSVNDTQEGDKYIHSWAIEDGSFLKLSNVTLGYTFPKKMLKKIGISKLRLYATGSNLLTWTKYSGFDPESSTRGNGLTPGVDFGAYPKSRSFVFGINLAF